jgi:hypothetical protein
MLSKVSVIRSLLALGGGMLAILTLISISSTLIW